MRIVDILGPLAASCLLAACNLPDVKPKDGEARGGEADGVDEPSRGQTRRAKRAAKGLFQGDAPAVPAAFAEQGLKLGAPTKGVAKDKLDEYIELEDYPDFYFSADTELGVIERLSVRTAKKQADKLKIAMTEAWGEPRVSAIEGFEVLSWTDPNTGTRAQHYVEDEDVVIEFSEYSTLERVFASAAKGAALGDATILGLTPAEFRAVHESRLLFLNEDGEVAPAEATQDDMAFYIPPLEWSDTSVMQVSLGWSDLEDPDAKLLSFEFDLGVAPGEPEAAALEKAAEAAFGPGKPGADVEPGTKLIEYESDPPASLYKDEDGGWSLAIGAD